MNYIPLASAPPPLLPITVPPCVNCKQGGMIQFVQSPCGCSLPLHPACQRSVQMQAICPYCRSHWNHSSASSVATSRTEIVYQPNRVWILYSLGCTVLLISACIIAWFLYKAF